jgi:hypothetical protein
MTSTTRRGSRARFLLLAAIVAVAVTASVAPPAGAHRGGSWMLPADVQRGVEARGFDLAICSGRGAYRIPRNAPPDRRWFLFRHFECFVLDRVVCVHTRPGKRLLLVPKPLGHTCRF